MVHYLKLFSFSLLAKDAICCTGKCSLVSSRFTPLILGYSYSQSDMGQSCKRSCLTNVHTSPKNIISQEHCLSQQ